MKRMTRGCARHGHPEFEIEVGDLDEQLTSGLFGYLEDAVAAGTKFLPGQSIQFGFQFLRIEEDGARLTLSTPAPGSIPWRFERNVAHAVAATLRHKFVLESFGIEEKLDFPNPRTSAIMCRRAGSSEQTGLVREAASEPSVSGWLAMCVDEDHDHDDPEELEAISVYELAIRMPVLDLFVAMPPGSIVVFGRDGVREVLLDGERLSMSSGSFVDTLARDRRWPLPRPS